MLSHFRCTKLLVLVVLVSLACSATAQPNPEGPNCSPGSEQHKCNNMRNPPCNVAKNGGSLCTKSCACMIDLYRSHQIKCTDDTEARIFCDDISNVYAQHKGQAIFDIYTAEKQDWDGEGYSVVIEARIRQQAGRALDPADAWWNACFRRRGKSSDGCGCKCAFILRMRPKLFKNCRCVKGI
jgi:hypothetical protein